MEMRKVCLLVDMRVMTVTSIHHGIFALKVNVDVPMRYELDT